MADPADQHTLTAVAHLVTLSSSNGIMVLVWPASDTGLAVIWVTGVETVFDSHRMTTPRLSLV